MLFLSPHLGLVLLLQCRKNLVISLQLPTMFTNCSFTSSLEARFAASALDNFGLQPSFFNFDISKCIFLTSPIHPLPLSTPPVVTMSTFPRFMFLHTILAIEMTSILSSFPTLNISNFLLFTLKQKKKQSTQSFTFR